MTVRSRVRANLFAHIVEAHGWPEPRPRRRFRLICVSCWAANRWGGCNLRKSWRIARNCAQRGR